MIGIYKIENKVNGKVYIGKSIDIERRWGEHITSLRNNSHYNWKLQNDWNKYGEDCFEFSVVFQADKNNPRFNTYKSECSLYVLEDYYMTKYKAISCGYNIERTIIKIMNGDSSVHVFNGGCPNKTMIQIISNLYRQLNNNRCDIEYIENFSYKSDGKTLKKKSKTIFNKEIDRIVREIQEYDTCHYASMYKICSDVGISQTVVKDIREKFNIVAHKDMTCDIKDFGNGLYLKKVIPETIGFKEYYQVVIDEAGKSVLIDAIMKDGTDRMIKKSIRDTYNKVKQQRR